MSLALTKLGLAASATTTEVKARWRQLAMLHHPDRGGDTAVFQELKKHYEQALQEVGEAPTKPTKSIFVSPCSFCGGRGRFHVIHGISVMTMACAMCNGTGRFEV